MKLSSSIAISTAIALTGCSLETPSKVIGQISQSIYSENKKPGNQPIINCNTELSCVTGGEVNTGPQFLEKPSSNPVDQPNNDTQHSNNSGISVTINFVTGNRRAPITKEKCTKYIQSLQDGSLSKKVVESLSNDCSTLIGKVITLNSEGLSNTCYDLANKFPSEQKNIAYNNCINYLYK